MKTEGVTSEASVLFKGAANLSKKEAAQATQAARTAGDATFQFDAVGVEVERYKFLTPEEVEPFVRCDADGLLNQFHMMYNSNVQLSLPLPAALLDLQADRQPPAP